MLGETAFRKPWLLVLIHILLWFMLAQLLRGCIVSQAKGLSRVRKKMWKNVNIFSEALHCVVAHTHKKNGVGLSEGKMWSRSC